MLNEVIRAWFYSERKAAAAAAAAAAESLQSCLTLCNPIGSSPPGSSIHGILQARVLEWGAIAFSPERASTLIRRGRDTRDVFISLGMHRGKVM